MSLKCLELDYLSIPAVFWVLQWYCTPGTVPAREIALVSLSMGITAELLLCIVAAAGAEVGSPAEIGSSRQAWLH